MIRATGAPQNRSPADGLSPGRAAERVQVNPFHGDQGMFGIALGHVRREVKGDLAVLPAAHMTGSLGAFTAHQAGQESRGQDLMDETRDVLGSAGIRPHRAHRR